MKFCLIDNKGYREYRGYIFFGSNPVTITDKHTEILLQLDKSFKRVDDVPRETIVNQGITGTITLKKAGRPKKVH